jgi:hypothetical protein
MLQIELDETVGRFIAAFANTKTVVHMVARSLLGVTGEKARVIFANMRLSDVIDACTA